MEPDRSADAQPCWADVHFPQFNARIHLSYMPVSGPDNFNELVEDARTFAFNHTVRATAIDQQRIRYPENGVYGQIGRTSCRERVCQSGKISVVHVTIKK